jgi:hypothetical protein
LAVPVHSGQTSRQARVKQDKEMAAAFEEKVERARQELRVGLRKQCSANVPNEVVDAAEAFVWHGSIATQAQQSHQRASDLPDRKTLALYIARAADERILNQALMRATVHELDKKDGIDVGSVAQRVRARSRGRNSTVPQTVVEAGTTVKGQLLSAVTYVSVLVLVLVVYVVERTKQ